MSFGCWKRRLSRASITPFILASGASVSEPHAGITGSCTPVKERLSLLPFKKMLRLLQFADTLNTNTTMALLHRSATPPPHTHTPPSSPPQIQSCLWLP